MAFKVDIKSLAIVQVMVGIVILLFGVSIKNVPSKAVSSGITYWGALCIIICGSISIFIVKKRLPSWIKASLGMNLVSTVAALGAFIAFCVDLESLSKTFKEKEAHCPEADIEKCGPVILVYLLRGLFRVLMVFSIFEICISIWTFVLIWKSRDSTEPIS